VQILISGWALTTCDSSSPARLVQDGSDRRSAARFARWALRKNKGVIGKRIESVRNPQLPPARWHSEIQVHHPPLVARHESNSWIRIPGRACDGVADQEGGAGCPAVQKAAEWPRRKIVSKFLGYAIRHISWRPSRDYLSASAHASTHPAQPSVSRCRPSSRSNSPFRPTISSIQIRPRANSSCPRAPMWLACSCSHNQGAAARNWFVASDQIFRIRSY
jgi:hypothetical protein